MNWRCAAVSAALPLAAAPLWAGVPCRGQSQELPDVAFELVWKGFRRPTHVAAAFDGSGRLFIVEQAGRILSARRGEKPRLFLDISDRVRSGGEMGLLSVAFHPEFAGNGRFFVDYTSGQGGLHTRVSEFRAGAKGKDLADPSSERILFTVAQPYSNHNGGQLAFGPDGRLYVGMGDGGSGNDPHNHAQDPDSFLGKMLRLDVDAKRPRPEIYALGLRNPWRFSFDPVTGRLFAGDVGQDKREEIDVIVPQGNYGWRVMEGFRCTPGIKDACEPGKYVAPVFDYPRRDGISVTGGFVYRGSALPALCGAYVFGDYGSGLVWGLRLDQKGKAQARVIADSGLNISSFGVDEDWELYAADHDGGAIHKIVSRKQSR